MKEVILTQGKIALIDDEDFLVVSQYKWFYGKINETLGYAFRAATIDGKRHLISLHRFILNPPNDKEIDHKNGIGVDCRKENLRIVTHAENMRNHKMHKNNMSGFRGVCWHKGRGKYDSYIKVNGKTKHLGYSASITEAVIKYNEGAIRYHGEFARLNPV